MSPAARLSRRSFRWAILSVLVVAGAWRGVTAALLPVISRDGVTFCWYARDLGTEGLDYLRSPHVRQHPLYPTAILGAQRLARALGAADTPWTWQRSGQVVSWAAGMAVIALVGGLTLRLVRRLELPLDERLAALVAMAWAALLDLHVWLSTDTMSDQVHLAFYLGALLLLVRLNRLPAALGCGVLAGLAFLTRPEGALPVLGGIAALAAARRQLGARKLAACAAALAVGFLACAAPYWGTVGRLSPKKEPWQSAAGVPVGHAPVASDPSLPAVARVRRFLSRMESSPDTEVRRYTLAADCWASQSATSSASIPATCRGADSAAMPADHAARAGFGAAGLPIPSVLLAKLELLDLPWYGLVPHVLYKLLRAGRVVVPLLAILPLLSLRRRLLSPELAGWTTCLVGHLALTLVLLHHYRYLDARHMLVPVTLLIPLAAMLLARMLRLLADVRLYWPAAALLAVCYLPPTAYALRGAGWHDRFLLDAARWLVALDPEVGSKRLLSGSSPQRIAFYANMAWESWAEKPEEYGVLARQLRAGGPGYFAVEIGAGFERAGNRELVEKLLQDEQLASHLGAVHTRPGPDQASELRLIELRGGK